MSGQSEQNRPFKIVIYQTTFVAGMIILVYLVESLTGADFYRLGVYPMKLSGVPGIIFSPLKHHDFAHLINNIILLIILLIGYFQHIRIKSPFGKLLLISIIANSWLWIAGREAWHYGASGLVYGLFFYLLVCSFRLKKKELLLFVLSCLVISAGFFIGLFPVRAEVSFEGHLFGSLSGILVGLFEKRPKSPGPPVSNISFSRDADFKYTYKEG